MILTSSLHNQPSTHSAGHVLYNPINPIAYRTLAACGDVSYLFTVVVVGRRRSVGRRHCLQRNPSVQL